MSHPRSAEAPAHKDPSKDASDFIYTNKAMRCCFICRLVKSERQVRKSKTARSTHAAVEVAPLCLQFLETGCENCQFLRMEEDRGHVQDYTTPNFGGSVHFQPCA